MMERQRNQERIGNRNSSELSRIKSEHDKASKVVSSVICPICHHPMTESTFTKYVDSLDMHGGVCWGGEEEVPVWKCQNGHMIHLVMMTDKRMISLEGL